MQNKFIKSISPSIKLVCLMLLIFELAIARSIYLILFITTFIILLGLISNINVNTHIKFIKSIYLILLIFLLLHIIVFRDFNIVSILLVTYKTIFILIIIMIYENYVNFNDIYMGIYSLLKPFKKFNIQKFSYDFTISLYFIKFLFESKEEIYKLQLLNGKKSFSLKYYFKPRLIYSINKLIDFELSKRSGQHVLLNKKNDFKSKLVLIIFLLFCILVVFKEVIL